MFPGPGEKLGHLHLWEDSKAVLPVILYCPVSQRMSRPRGKPFEDTVCYLFAKQMSAQGACSVPKQLREPVFSLCMIHFIPDFSVHCQGQRQGSASPRVWISPNSQTHLLFSQQILIKSHLSTRVWAAGQFAQSQFAETFSCLVFILSS